MIGQDRLGIEMAENTRSSQQQTPTELRLARTYLYQWHTFLRWCHGSGRKRIPAAPEDVAAYLKERVERGTRSSTLKVAAAAIASHHKLSGHANPCDSQIVQSILTDLRRNEEPAQRRSLPLDLDCYSAIRRTAFEPRMGRGGRLERPESARRRGAVDVAMIGLMRDGMLGVSEAAALTWGDILPEMEGTGLAVVRSDREREYRVLSSDTMRLLRMIRHGAADSEPVLGMRPNQIAARIGVAARQAGLGPGYSGESPRLGMIQDLATFGVLGLGRQAAEEAPVPISLIRQED